MSDDEDDFDGEEGFDFDRTGEDDARVRELMIEVTRLQAQIDQLAAADRERGEQIAELRRDMDELSEQIADLQRTRKKVIRRMYLIGLGSALLGNALAQVVIAIWF